MTAAGPAAESDEMQHALPRRESVWSVLPFKRHHLTIKSRRIIRAASVIGWNALFMFIAEVVIELLILFDKMPKVIFRLDFFALTTISALLGYQTLVGVAKRELDVTRNSLILAFLVEGFLVGGDVQFILSEGATKLVVAVRGPFIALTMVNFLLVTWMYNELHNTFRPDWPILFDVLFLRRRGDYDDDIVPPEPSREPTADRPSEPAHSDSVGVLVRSAAESGSSEKL